MLLLLSVGSCSCLYARAVAVVVEATSRNSDHNRAAREATGHERFDVDRRGVRKHTPSIRNICDLKLAKFYKLAAIARFHTKLLIMSVANPTRSPPIFQHISTLSPSWRSS